ncbi:MAG: long-chain acyl-CoA synthetase [Pseudonocardiales bacterium]|nr:long-chain acyl-CoA synthetase [Pseudonocardiales bacterium]
MYSTPIAQRAASDPDGRALATPAHALTWAELASTTDAAARALAALDLGAHRRVAVMAQNSVDTVLGYLAALHAGLSVVPVSFHLTAREVAYILGDSGAAAVLCDANSRAAAAEAAQLSGGLPVFSWDDGRSGGSSWAQLLETGAGEQPVDHTTAPRPNLLYTSGTTGFPKGVERPPSMPASIAEYLDAQREPPDAGTFLAVGPLYHTGPMRAVRRLAGGRPLFVLPSFDAEAVLATIDRERVSGTLMVPTHFARLLALPADVRAKYDVSSMRVIEHTGAACPVPVKHAMIDWFGPVLVEKYGGTETGTMTSIDSHEWLAHPGSVGRAVPPFEVVVVDDDDQPVPTGTEGRLYFRDTTGRGITFHGDPAKTAAAHIAPNVFTVGDIGLVDADGYVYITGRHSDMVVSGGVNLYPAESERVLLQHPLVRDAAVIGVPHPSMGEQLKALVVRSGDVSAEALIAHCRDNLAHPKCPRSVDFVDDLGRSPMGKLNKKALRAPYWADVGAAAPGR